MKRYVFSLFFLLTLMLGISLQAQGRDLPSVGVGAQIAGGQKDVDFSSNSTSSSSYSIVPNSVVTVNNGTSARNCILQFSTEVNTTAGDRAIIGYAIDSTNPSACGIFGPQYFHAGSGNFENATNISVANIAAGTHTIRPCFAVYDQNGGGATTTFYYRAFTIECKTN